MTNPKNFTLLNSFAPLRGFHRAGKIQIQNNNDRNLFINCRMETSDSIVIR
ncbi:hypothetical protein ES705_08941 [subsurface metagenome]